MSERTRTSGSRTARRPSRSPARSASRKASTTRAAQLERADAMTQNVKEREMMRRREGMG
jgi:hypothetical protein